MSKHLIIPDCQIRPGDDTKFLNCIGKYIVEKKPDVVVCLGDFADMPSLSSYDIGKKVFEGRRYKLDVESVKHAMEVLMNPLQEYNKKQKKQHRPQYKPRLVLTLGNHEDRITRATNSDPKLDGTISLDDLGYKEFGWEVHPFLEVVCIEGIAYSHYFISGVMGRPITSAAATLSKKHMSCIAGHQQGLQIAMSHKADGKSITSLISGSCYLHDEDYLGPQGNKHWRGIIMAHNVNDGEFDVMPVALSYLRNKYGTVSK